MTAAQLQRLDSEILNVRLALLDSMPTLPRLRLEAELRDLRLARVGVEGKHTRARLVSLGILPGGSVHHRGPEQWGEAATRVQVA